MIQLTQLYPAKPIQDTEWPSLERIRIWGSECDRKVLDSTKTSVLIFLPPFGPEGVRICYYTLKLRAKRKKLKTLVKPRR